MTTECLKIAVLCLFTSLALIALPGSAAPTSYNCIVSTELHLRDDGTLRPYPQPLVIGSRFSVDRRTGELVGPGGRPWSFAESVTSLHAPGNSDNSFVASYVGPMKGGEVHFTLLRIEEFFKSPRKPFIAVSGRVVYSGLCD
jgi:hypothetical protein